MNPSDFDRLERKVDTLTDAINRLVLFEERQSVQAGAIASLVDTVRENSRKIETVDSRVSKWVNRGIGAWAVAGLIGAVAMKVIA